ncbi:MAG: fructose-bisphosphatase class II [Candidatus Bathyarchaeota archaeon]|nr:fructose-bisphosphatase class II [Candidatus Bathyarchaeota archaeon]
MVSLRALAPSLTRITVAAAVGAALHIGQGDPNLIDAKAVEFLRAVLAQTDVEGEVISCEGPKDNAPAFMKREKVGTGKGPKVEFVIDPVDGSTAASKGRKDAISALACAPAGCFQVLPDDGYYFKVATDYNSIGKISLDMPIEEIVRTVAKEKSLPLENFTVIILERKVPRWNNARKSLERKKDDPKRLERLKKEGVNTEKVYNQDELAKGNELVFAASGVTKGELLDGVRFIPNGAIINSICMRLPSGTLEKSETTLRFKAHPIYKHFIIK